MEPKAALNTFIWKEIEKLWIEVCKHRPSHKVMGIPPDFLRVREYSKADWERGRCEGEVLRTIEFGDFGKRELSSPFPTDSFDHPRGAYWRIGSIAYHLDPEGKRAVFTFVVGPRYGRGFILERKTADGRAVIVPRKSWIS